MNQEEANTYRCSAPKRKQASEDQKRGTGTKKGGTERVVVESGERPGPKIEEKGGNSPQGGK